MPPKSGEGLLGKQLAANCDLRCDLALRVADGNGLSDGQAAVRVVDGVGDDDFSVSRECRVDFPHKPAVVVVALHSRSSFSPLVRYAWIAAAIPAW